MKIFKKYFIIAGAVSSDATEASYQAVAYLPTAIDKLKPKFKMPRTCAVPTCTNRQNKTAGRNVCYHRFPADPSIRKVWIKATKRADISNISYAVICSDHFQEEDFVRNLQAELLGEKPKSKKLKATAIPTLYLGNGDDGVKEPSARQLRYKIKQHKDLIDSLLRKKEQSESSNVVDTVTDTPKEVAEDNTEKIQEMVDELIACRATVDNLENKMKILEKALSTYRSTEQEMVKKLSHVITAKALTAMVKRRQKEQPAMKIPQNAYTIQRIFIPSLNIATKKKQNGESVTVR